MSQNKGQKFLSHLIEKRRHVRFHIVAQAVAVGEAVQNPVSAIQAGIEKTFGNQVSDFATFDLSLTEAIAPLGTTPDSAADPAPQNLAAEDIAREYEKRRTINALMQGGAVVGALEAIRQSDLPKEMRRHYADLVSIGMFQQVVEQVGGAGGMNDGERPPAGIVEVSQDDNGIQRIRARAVNGAVLAHEAAKGLLELAAMWGAPGAEDNNETPPMIKDYNFALRQEVMRRTDRPEHELEDTLRGLVLWVDHFGREIGPETLRSFQDLCLLPATEFNAVLGAKIDAPQSVMNVANDNSQNLTAMLDENMRVNNTIKTTLDTAILPHTNLPTDDAARTAILNWVSGPHLRNHLAAQPGGAMALTTPALNSELKHIIDYLHAALTEGGLPKEHSLTAVALQASTYQVLAAKAQNWMVWQSKQTINGVMKEGLDYKVVMELEGGMRLVELKTSLALDYEGQKMGHCIGGNYDERLNGNDGYRQYSVWDAKGAPHCTFEAHNGILQQCQGKENKPPVVRYVPAVMAAILGQGWKLGQIPAARTGLVTDQHGQIYSVYNLPEVFDGDLPLDGLQTGVRLPHHVKGSVSVRNAASVDISRFKKADGQFNAYGTPMAEVTTAHLRAIQVRGKATLPMGAISDKQGRIYSAYDLCDEVFDGDVDLSSTNVTTLGQHCKKITGSVFNGVALIDTGAVEEVVGDIRGCHALQSTHVKKVGGNLAGLLALTQAHDLEEVGKSVLILPLLSDAPRLQRVGKNFYLNSTALTQAHPDLQIGCIKDAELSAPSQPKPSLLQQLFAHNSEQAPINHASSLIARRAAKSGRIEIGGDEWSELIDIHQSGDIMPDKTILVAKTNDRVLMTLPKQLPQWESWNELAKDATEEEIKAQRIPVNHILKKQGVDNLGYVWFMPTMTDKGPTEQCYAIYQASDNGALKGVFDKSGSSNASTFWSARRNDRSNAYYQWMGDGHQLNLNLRRYALPVSVVRDEPRRTQGVALVI